MVHRTSYKRKNRIFVKEILTGLDFDTSYLAWLHPGIVSKLLDKDKPQNLEVSYICQVYRSPACYTDKEKITSKFYQGHHETSTPLPNIFGSMVDSFLWRSKHLDSVQGSNVLDNSFERQRLLLLYFFL